MKINPGWRPIDKNIRLTDSPTGQPIPPRGFEDYMGRQREQATLEELQQRLKQISVQGERMSKSMTIRELRLYKQMVKQFLEETIKRGVGIKETRGWDRRGRTKRYKLIEEIDAGLLGMAEELLSTEEGRIELLRKVGDIRGLLLNLLF